MNRKLSCKQKSLNFQTIAQARKIYHSTKKLQGNQTARKNSKSNYQSIKKPVKSIDYVQKDKRKNSVYQSSRLKDNFLPPIQFQQLINLPAFKKYDSQSTAEDFSQKLKKEQSKQLKPIKIRNKKIQSFLFAQMRKNSEQTSLEKQYPTISYESQYQQQHVTRRKVLQCKIIKNPKIPFPLQRKSIQKQNKFQVLQAQTQHISEIKLQGVVDFISPQSKFLIDF